MIIETKRLILRPYEHGDAGSMFKYASDPAVGTPAGWPPHKSIEESQRIVDAFSKKPELFAIVPKEVGEAAGCIEIKKGGDTDMTDRGDEGELGYWIGRPFWGRGIMPEAVNAVLYHAFEELKLNAVWCGYYEGNERSRKVQEKCGFVELFTTEGLYLPQMDEYRTGHVSIMTRAAWLLKTGQRQKNSFDLIYEQVMKVPRGKVATYGQIARMAGNPRWSRVVGFALHVNPSPGVIPCHRIVDRNGRLSPAFAFGGINIQERLLSEEGVEVTEGQVDLGKYRFYSTET